MGPLLGNVKKEAIANLWPGYRGQMSWGTWFVMQWPVKHPDTHCEAGKYSPNRYGICTSCGWIPETAVCCKRHRVYLRDMLEVHLLLRTSAWQSRHFPFLSVAYQGFVEVHRPELTASPTFTQVKRWWRGLSDQRKQPFVASYNVCRYAPVSVRLMIRKPTTLHLPK